MEKNIAIDVTCYHCIKITFLAEDKMNSNLQKYMKYLLLH